MERDPLPQIAERVGWAVGPQTWDGVIPQDNRSVNPGGHRPYVQEPRFGRHVGRSDDRITLEALNLANQDHAVVFEDCDKILVRSTKAPGTRAPAKNRSGPIEPSILHEVVAIPIGVTKQRTLSKLSKIGLQGSMKIGASDELYTCTFGK